MFPKGPIGFGWHHAGDTVPGIGRIDSIVRWANRWIVATAIVRAMLVAVVVDGNEADVGAVLTAELIAHAIARLGALLLPEVGQ
jgi:hypothetical protein